MVVTETGPISITWTPTAKSRRSITIGEADRSDLGESVPAPTARGKGCRQHRLAPGVCLDQAGAEGNAFRSGVALASRKIDLRPLSSSPTQRA